MEKQINLIAAEAAEFINLWIKTKKGKEDFLSNMTAVIENAIYTSKAWYLPEDKMPDVGSEIVYAYKNTKSIGIVYAENNQAVIVINKMLQLTLPVVNIQKWRYL